MQTDMRSLPGYRLNDYLLVLQPHEQLKNKIAQVKKEFAQKYEAPSAEWGRPAITVLKFSQIQLMEERLQNRLRFVAMAMPAFKIDLSDYGSQPTHSIFINVVSQNGIQLLQKRLKPAQRLMQTRETKPHFIDNPQIVIARQLLPWQFEKGWLDFSHRHFTGSFVADSMVLLRRSEGAPAFQPVQRYEFKNMPVLTTQGQLFA